MHNFQYICGHEWLKLSPKKQEKYLEDATMYWRARGFPHYDLKERQIIQEYQQISVTKSEKIFLSDNQLQSSSVGLSLANYFHPQMWSVPTKKYKTPIDQFNDDKILKNLIRKSFVLWPSRKAASPSSIRRILVSYKDTRRVSNFRPTVAKAIIEHYSKPGDNILDFSAGYSGRLIASLTLDRHYVGWDPCSLQIEGLNNTINRLKELCLPKGSAEIHQVCAEDEIILTNHKFDLIFSSPPYFDLEHYSNEETQSYLRYPDYQRWREHFLRKIIYYSKEILKPRRYFILNIANTNGNKLADDAYEICSEVFTHETTLHLRMGVLPFNRRQKNNNYRYEPVFVFRN